MTDHTANVSRLEFHLENELLQENTVVECLLNEKKQDESHYGSIVFKNPHDDPLTVYMLASAGPYDEVLGAIHLGRDDCIRLAAFLKCVLATWPKECDEDRLDENNVLS